VGIKGSGSVGLLKGTAGEAADGFKKILVLQFPSIDVDGGRILDVI
jgi:hypothetical protein